MALSKSAVEQYKNRIGYVGELKPTLSVLQNLQKTHLLSVPFENLDIHYNTPIELNISKIFEKIVLHKRGGFCYELNGLFFELLTHIGFLAKRVSARVYNEATGYSSEFDHMAIVITIGNNDYLTDVGFGEFAFAPLLLKNHLLQKDDRGNFRVDNYDPDYLRITKEVNGERIPEYIFKNEPHPLEAFTDRCHYQQTSPESHFTKNKLISLPTENGRITLTSDKLKVVKGDIITESEIKDEDIFVRELRKYFHVSL